MSLQKVSASVQLLLLSRTTSRSSLQWSLSATTAHRSSNSFSWAPIPNPTPVQRIHTSASVPASVPASSRRSPARMAPPKSAADFVDFVNASPTRESHAHVPVPRVQVQ